MELNHFQGKNCFVTRSAMEKDIEIVSGSARVLAQESLFVGLVNGHLDIGAFVVELAADVNVSGTGAHGFAGDQTALDQLVRVVAHNLAVLARARLALVGVDDQVTRTAVRRLVHEAPLHPAGESGTSSPPQTRFLHLICNTNIGN